jgi:hypothetical protein
LLDELFLDALGGHQVLDRPVARGATSPRSGLPHDGAQALGRAFHQGAADLRLSDSQAVANDAISREVNDGHAYQHPFVRRMEMGGGGSADQKRVVMRLSLNCIDCKRSNWRCPY